MRYTPLSEERDLRFRISLEERLKRPDLNVMKEHIGRNYYIRIYDAQNISQV